MLSVPASRYLPVDGEGIPLGPAASIHGTPLDFRRAKAVGRDLRAGSAQLAATRGFDHSLLLDGWRQGHVIPAARMEEPETGRFLELLTDQPAVALLGQHAGRVSGRQRTANLPSERRSVPRDTALPGFTEQELLPQCRPQTGRAVEVDDDVEVRIVRRSCGATGQGLAIHTNVEVTT